MTVEVEWRCVHDEAGPGKDCELHCDGVQEFWLEMA